MQIRLCCAAIILIGVQLPHAGAGVEKLAEPCRAFNVLSARVVKDPAGRESFVLGNMNEVSGLELIFIDLTSGEGKTYRAPAGAGAWAMLEAPENRLILGTFYDGKFIVFDLAKRTFAKAISFPGEEYIWNLARGSDGRIYGGTYPGAKLGALDLQTYAVEDLGAPVKPNLYLRNVTELPEGRVLCSFMSERSIEKIYDPKKKAWQDVPENFVGVKTGILFDGKFIAGSKAYDAELKESALPFPKPPDETAWSIDVLATTPRMAVIHQGDTIWTFKSGDSALKKVWSGSLHGGGVRAGQESGELVGVRGKDYFVLSEGQKELQLKPMPSDGSPRKPLFLKYDGAGKLWGGPTFGQTLFWLDVKSRKFENTAQICDHGGEVYSVAFKGGKVYAIAYAGGDIVEYDPKQPWDELSNKNPRVIAEVASKGYIRPEGGVVVGPDGKLYSGWLAKYGTYGGAVAITDPTDGKTELIENPLGNQGVSGVAVDQEHISVGTTLAGNGLPAQKGAATFGMIDRKSREVVWKKQMPAGVGPIVVDAASHLIALKVGAALKAFDPEKKTIEDLSAGLTSNIAGRGDGKIYFGVGKKLMEQALSDRKAREVGEIPGTIEEVDVGAQGEVLVGSGVGIWRIAIE